MQFENVNRQTDVGPYWPNMFCMDVWSGQEREGFPGKLAQQHQRVEREEHGRDWTVTASIAYNIHRFDNIHCGRNRFSIFLHPEFRMNCKGLHCLQLCQPLCK